ncbi:ribosomal L28 family-domain-containing protein, partial [Pyronema domesticum]
LSRSFPTIRVFSRSFSSTPAPCAKHSKERLNDMLADLPPYPFPIKHTFKQHWFGLYGGKHKQFGNNVPESRYKTRRTWLPNVKQRKLYSECLGRWVDLKLAACVLRTVDKSGGLDNYLTGGKAARIKELGPFGWKLRWDIMSSKKYLQKRAAELEAMGLLE